MVSVHVPVSRCEPVLRYYVYVDRDHNVNQDRIRGARESKTMEQPTKRKWTWRVVDAAMAKGMHNFKLPRLSRSPPPSSASQTQVKGN